MRCPESERIDLGRSPSGKTARGTITTLASFPHSAAAGVGCACVLSSIHVDTSRWRQSNRGTDNINAHASHRVLHKLDDNKILATNWG